MSNILDSSLVLRIQSLNPNCLRLNLSRNNLVEPEDDAVLLPFSDLIHLNLSNNALRSLSPAFSVLSKLQVLDVSHNKMCVCFKINDTRRASLLTRNHATP